MTLTMQMIAVVQWLMMSARGPAAERLERIETYLIDRINRE